MPSYSYILNSSKERCEKMARTNKFGTPATRAQPDKTNFEGAPAFSGTLKMDTMSALMTGSTCDTFYAGKESQFESFSKIFAQMAKTDPKWFAKAILFARKEGFQRAIPIYALAHLSVESTDLFKSIYADVVRNPQDAKNFLDILRSGRVRGIGRSIKSEINAQIGRLTPYDAIKYPKNVEDMINLARPKETINKSVIDYIKKGELGDNEVFNALKALPNADSMSRYMAIKDFNLPYESVTSQVGNDAMAWKALYEIAPHFNLVRNLRNFIEKGVAEKDIGERILKHKEGAMLFPFRYFQAYKAVEDISGNRDAVSLAKNALNTCIDMSVNKLPDYNGRIVVGVDSSGSMTSATTNESMSASEVANLFGTMMSKRYKAPIISFAESVKGIYTYRKGSILESARRLPNAAGGTSLASPIQMMIDKDVEMDLFLGFTDNEEWCNGRFLEAWRTYRRKYPKAQAVLVQLIPTKSFPTPPKEPGVRYVYGWSEQVLQFCFTDMEQIVNKL